MFSYFNTVWQQAPGLVATMVLFVVATLLWVSTRALKEGREVSFWPPRIGPRNLPQTTGSATAPAGAKDSHSHGSGHLPHVTLAATPIAVLHIEAGAGHGTAYLISDELRSITLGRGADANISLQDVELTRSHARINITPLPRPGGGQRSYELELVDSGSANGTFVNGMRIRDTLLAHGDLIQLGGVRARVFVLASSGRLS